MSKTYRLIVILVLAGAAFAVLTLKSRRQEVDGSVVPPREPVSTVAAEAATPATTENPPTGEALPRLVDLGADKCIPCKMMAPILEELKKDFANTFEVEFIDVWKNPDAGEKYGIRMIPTQIFYDGGGKELFRHEGFFGKEQILAKWKEHGVVSAAESRE